MNLHKDTGFSHPRKGKESRNRIIIRVTEKALPNLTRRSGVLFLRQPEDPGSPKIRGPEDPGSPKIQWPEDSGSPKTREPYVRPEAGGMTRIYLFLYNSSISLIFPAGTMMSCSDFLLFSVSITDAMVRSIFTEKYQGFSVSSGLR